MKARKKFLSVLLALIMVMSIILTAAADETDAWDGAAVNTDWYTGDKSCYTINTGAELAGLAKMVNDGNSFSKMTIMLGDDIDLGNKDWTPIGIADKPFLGTFDGQNHTISNLYIHSTAESGAGFGLFGVANGSVKDLTIDNAHVKGNSACGAFVGNGNGLLENLQLTGSFSIGTTTDHGYLANFNSSYIGGIRGYSFRGKIKNCTVNGSEGSVIGGGRQVGGILGFDSYGFVDSVVDCTVKNVTVIGGKSIGGVVGWANSTGIRNCSIENVRVELTNAGEPETIGLISGTSRCLIDDTETTVYENNTVDLASVLVVNGETPAFDSDPVLRLYSPYSSKSYITLADGKYMFTCYDLATAITKGDDITLLALRSDPVTIPAGRTITIDLHGNTIAGDFGVPAVINNGTLTIKNGTVVGEIVGDNVTEVNITKQEPTCVAKIGDTKYSDLSKALNAAQDGEVVTLTQNIEYKTRIEIATGKKITLDLAGNTLTSYAGDAILIYNQTELLIKDSVGGGMIDHKGSDDICWSQATLIFESGCFKTTGEYGIAYNSYGGTTTISGGYYTIDPTAYLADDKVIVPSDLAGYDYKVGDPAVIGEGNTEVHPAPDAEPESDATAIPEETRSSVKAAIDSASSEGLNVEAAAVAQNPEKVTEENVSEGLAAVQKETFGSNVTDASDIKLVVQPYLYIEAKNYTATDTEKILHVDITPKYNLLATEKDTDVTQLNTTGDKKNAVVVESGQDLPVDQDTRVTICFQLPDGFVDEMNKDNLYVVHTKKDGSTETYKVNVSVENGGYIATFTTNGFSPFVFMVDVRSASVQFLDKDGNALGAAIDYLPTNVGNELPVVEAPNGKVFGGWSFDGIYGIYLVLTDELLTALAEENSSETITATPVFYSISSNNSDDAYRVVVAEAAHGAVTADRTMAYAGTTVTLTVKPDTGYTLENLTVTDGSGKEVKITKKSGKYTFIMPASKVTVKATFMEDNSMLNFFVDVPADAYYYDAVLWAADKGITGGTDDNHFSPNTICTRAQAVTFLWRSAGSPAPKSNTMPFADVKAASYYYDAVLWAVENGITKGASDTAFSPNATCSRGQIVTFLWRSQESPVAGTVNPFTDVKADDYYANAVLWAVKEDVTNGTTDITFSPYADCTRAQIVTFIWRTLGE